MANHTAPEGGIVGLEGKEGRWVLDSPVPRHKTAYWRDLSDVAGSGRAGSGYGAKGKARGGLTGRNEAGRAYRPWVLS